MISTIIFDMDGVITDSEPLHHEAEKQLLANHGVTVTSDELTQFTGMGSHAMLALFIKQFDLNTTADNLYPQLQALLYQLFIDKVQPVPYIESLIELFYRKAYQLSVGSSSSQKLIRAALNRLNLLRYFPVIVSGGDVANSKPAPDIFLKITDILHVSPNSCLVIEDSYNGVRAAKDAGMHCIGFRSPNSGDQNLEKADCIVEHLSDITVSLVESF